MKSNQKNIDVSKDVSKNEITADPVNEEQFNEAAHAQIIIQQALKNSLFIHEKDEYGCTPLHWAASSGTLEDIRQLIQKGGATDLYEVDNSGYTPLHWAIKEGNLDKIKLFLSYGSNVNYIDPSKTMESALTFASNLELANQKEILAALNLDNEKNFHQTESPQQSIPDFMDVNLNKIKYTVINGYRFDNKNDWILVLEWFIQHNDLLKNEKVYQLTLENGKRRTKSNEIPVNKELLMQQLNYLKSIKDINNNMLLQPIDNTNIKALCDVLTSYAHRHKQQFQPEKNTISDKDSNSSLKKDTGFVSEPTTQLGGTDSDFMLNIKNINIDNYENLLVDHKKDLSPSFVSVDNLLDAKAQDKLYTDTKKNPDTSARARFIKYLSDKVQNDPSKNFKGQGIDPENDAVTLKDLLGADGVKLYEDAIKEEMQSKAFRDAVFIKSLMYSDAKPWPGKVIIWAAGPSASGKSFTSTYIINKINEQNVLSNGTQSLNSSSELQADKVGNLIANIDGGIERKMSQMRRLVLEVAKAKGHPGIADLHEHTKLSVKKYVEKASHQNKKKPIHLYIPTTFTGVVDIGKIHKFNRLKNTTQIFSEIRPPIGKRDDFKQLIAEQGKSRAFLQKGQYGKEYIANNKVNSIDIDHIDKDRDVESKAYKDHFLAGTRLSKSARLFYRKISKDNIYIKVTNDRICVHNNGGIWEKCAASEANKIVMAERDYNRFIEDQKKNPNLDLKNWMIENKKNLSTPIIEITQHGQVLNQSYSTATTHLNTSIETSIEKGLQHPSLTSTQHLDSVLDPTRLDYIQMGKALIKIDLNLYKSLDVKGLEDTKGIDKIGENENFKKKFETLIDLQNSASSTLEMIWKDCFSVDEKFSTKKIADHISERIEYWTKVAAYLVFESEPKDFNAGYNIYTALNSVVVNTFHSRSKKYEEKNLKLPATPESVENFKKLTQLFNQTKNFSYMRSQVDENTIPPVQVFSKELFMINEVIKQASMEDAEKKNEPRVVVAPETIQGILHQANLIKNKASELLSMTDVINNFSFPQASDNQSETEKKFLQKVYQTMPKYEDYQKFNSSIQNLTNFYKTLSYSQTSRKQKYLIRNLTRIIKSDYCSYKMKAASIAYIMQQPEIQNSKSANNLLIQFKKDFSATYGNSFPKFEDSLELENTYNEAKLIRYITTLPKLNQTRSDGLNKKRYDILGDLIGKLTAENDIQKKVNLIENALKSETLHKHHLDVKGLARHTKNTDTTSIKLLINYSKSLKEILNKNLIKEVQPTVFATNNSNIQEQPPSVDLFSQLLSTLKNILSYMGIIPSMPKPTSTPNNKMRSNSLPSSSTSKLAQSLKLNLKMSNSSLNNEQSELDYLYGKTNNDIEHVKQKIIEIIHKNDNSPVTLLEIKNFLEKQQELIKDITTQGNIDDKKQAVRGNTISMFKPLERKISDAMVLVKNLEENQEKRMNKL